MSELHAVVGIGAHPDDLEVVMGGTAAILARRGLAVLFVDLTDGEPSRHAPPGVRRRQAEEAARILGVDRITMEYQDRLLKDTPEARIAVAALIRTHRPRYLFTSGGCGVHPDHKAITEIVINGAFYARLSSWEAVPGGEALADSQPHEIERLFLGHCRMEPPWDRFDFAVDVSEVYDRKRAALAAYTSVFGGDQKILLDRFEAEDRYVGSLVGVEYAEPFKARGPLLVDDPTVFRKVRYG
ncbi:MAG: PIG-L family deacetylase [Gemmatimonadales bacterium]|jgi:LmbE family N-acetylglucosaminyl deacetylase